MSWQRFIALAVLLVLGVACRGPNPQLEGEALSVEALRFPHESHKSVACLVCHEPDPSRPYQSLRPGTSNHESCNQAECHRAAFESKPTELCALCHESIASKPGEDSPLMPYPPTQGRRAMAATFSHKSHLDFANMEAQLGFHVSCTDCHGLADDGSLIVPGHASCSRCHAAESTPTGAPSMSECQSCHRSGTPEPLRQRTMITGDLQFEHKSHRNDRKGNLITCSTCHLASAQAEAEDIGKHAAPNMRACVDCHDDANRTPANKRMRRCQTCHATRAAGIRALAPRSHMPATARPADHTRAFRRDHEMDARADPKRCARCHTVLSGNARDTCDECHQVMRPGDHVVTWREYDHGPDAATDPDRCVTCHQVDYCVACHQQTPRSHFPLIEFRQGGHGTQAVLDLRACVTCHDPQRDCSGSGCHTGGLR